MPIITIVAPQHQLSGYLQKPAGKGPWPGVLVLHDAFGQTADNRRQVEWLAAAGFITLAPDLYSWGGRKLFCIRNAGRDVMARKGETFDDIEASRAALAALPECTGKVGVIGFCMGGGFALLIATSKGYAASSVNYGMVPKDAEAILAGACPVVGSFGARDPSLKGAAGKLERALQTNGVEHDVKDYAEASHGFLNNHDGKLGWVLARLGMRWNEASAVDARARIVAFFQKHLETGSGA